MRMAFVAGALCANPGCGQDSSDEITSVFTDLKKAGCKAEADSSDPNETVHQICPGVGDHALVVRPAGSGRTTVDVRMPDGSSHPLDLQTTVTSAMSHVGERAEWLVRRVNGAQTPVAVVIPLLAHEDEDEPALVTQTYLAVVKITPARACVVERIVQGAMGQVDVSSTADAAATGDCL